MGIASGVAGLVGGLSGLFGGGGNPMPPAPPSFQMPNMGGAANNLYGGIQGLQPFSNLGQSSLGYGQNIFGAMQNNPYASSFQGGGNTAGALGQQQALNQYGLGSSMIGAGTNLGNLAGSVVNSAFDPQSQLYGYLQNQNTQQSQANAAAAGLASTPYGIGLANQSNQLFNMNWQNQQLQREESGAQTAGGLVTQGAQLQGQGNALQAAAPGQYYGASGLPYGTFNQIGNDQYANLNQYLGIGGSGLNLANAQNQGWQNYLQLGNQSNQIANQLYGLQLGAQQQQFNQNQAFGSAIGSGLYNIGRGFTGGMSSPFLGSMFSGGGGYGGYSNALGSMGASINPYTGYITS